MLDSRKARHIYIHICLFDLKKTKTTTIKFNRFHNDTAQSHQRAINNRTSCHKEVTIIGT